MKLDKALKTIDAINEKVGRVFCFSLIILMLIQVMEVILRYIFNSPTIWAWDINGQIFIAAGMIAGAYALLHDTHVRVDILYRNWSPRKKAIIDLITFPLIFLALCLVIWNGARLGLWAWEHNQHAHTYFAPILWPVKSFLCISTVLLLLQAISKYTRIFLSLKKPGGENQQVI